MALGRTNIMISGGSGGGSGSEGSVDLPLNLKSFTASKGTAKVLLAWDYTNTNDLTGLQINYKTGSYPSSPSDGTSVVIADTTTKSKEITGLTNDTTYYFRAYPYREVDGGKYYQTYNENCKASATPSVFLEGAIDIDGSAFYLIPKATWAEMGVGTSNEIHPMFKVGGKVLDYVAIGRYEASLSGSKAVSKKGVSPKVSVTHTESETYCKNSGSGWHLITRLEWASIANWCAKNGITPSGNISGSSVLATGSSSSTTYSHNGKSDGIWDLCGNVWEWNSGFRLYKGELQVISLDGNFNNDAADASVDQSASSPYWYAVDGTTGSLIKPNGSGTTANSLKITASGWNISSSSANYSNGYDNITCASSSICQKAKDILTALGLLKNSALTSSTDDYLNLYKNTSGEYIGCSGGSYNSGSGAGVFAFSCYYVRTYSDTTVGFRPAFVPL